MCALQKMCKKYFNGLHAIGMVLNVSTNHMVLHDPPNHKKAGFGRQVILLYFM